MVDPLSFLYPTKDQLISYIGTAAKVGGGFLAGRGITVSPDMTALFFGPEAIQLYAGLAAIIIPVIRDRYIHSDPGKLAAASSLATGPNPVIKPIETLPTAPPPIQAVAEDRNVPGVKPSTSSAYSPPPPIQRK
jgi:hypothetical protein